MIWRTSTTKKILLENMIAQLKKPWKNIKRCVLLTLLLYVAIAEKLESFGRRISDLSARVSDTGGGPMISFRLKNVSEHALALQASICKTDAKDGRLTE